MTSEEYTKYCDTVFEITEDLRSFRDRLSSRLLPRLEDPLLGDVDDLTDRLMDLLTDLTEKEEKAFMMEAGEDAEV